MSLFSLSKRSGTAQVLTDLKAKGTSHISNMYQVFQNVDALLISIDEDLASDNPSFETADGLDCKNVKNGLLKATFLKLAESVDKYPELSYTDKENLINMANKL
jgi:hypothetical protein